MRQLRLTSARYFQRHHASRLAERVPQPNLAGFTSEQVAFAARAWTMRAEEEHHSAAIFSDLLSLVVDADVPLDLLAHVTRIIGDELRHTELCAELARRFGATPPRSRALPRGRPPMQATERRTRGFEILLIEGAIGETLSSALFNAGRHVAEEPCTKAALSLILRDEVLHARSFWEALGTVKSDWGPADLEHLHDYARRALGALEKRMVLPALQRLERGEPFDAAWGALGVLPPERRADAFYSGIERRVVPRLDDLGLDGDSAWKNRYLIAS
jgi:hypothetical protein